MFLIENLLMKAAPAIPAGPLPPFIYVWGRNQSGQLGDGTTTHRSSPVQIGTNSWTAVSVPGYSRVGDARHTAAIRSDGALFTWGFNNRGQLGDGTTTTRSSPVQIGSSSLTAVSAGSEHTLAIRSDGRLFAWGYQSAGRLGNGSGSYSGISSPVQIGSSSWTAVAAGYKHNLAIRLGGGLFAWGYQRQGRLGNGVTV